ncbi:MAG TPA: hypothetical protein VFL03_02075 [Candidatus Limnocylindrales bacterium]|nr:hypothetical protein [Candidatus Limnocylindrales bacterium]
MTAPTRLEQDLPELLAQLAGGTRPEYRDSLVQAVGRTRQRPAWAFPGRWLPMDLATTRLRSAPMPIRPLLLALLLLVAVASAALLIAAAQHPVPAPFGPARNGILAYGRDGDLYAMDSDGTREWALLADPAAKDSDPRFSPLGDRLVFAREVDNAWQLWLVNPDGSGLRQLTERLIGLESYIWSPDGTQIAAHHSVDGRSRVTLDETDGSGSRDIELAFGAGEPLWRPGHEGQLLVRSMDQDVRTLYLVDTATDTASELDLPRDPAAPVPTYDGQRPDWSPDGNRLVVEQGLARYSDAGRPVIRLRVADIGPHGTVLASRLLEHEPGADYEFGATWLTTGAGLTYGMQAGCVFQVYVTEGEDVTNARPVGDPIDDCTNLGIGISSSPDATRALKQRTANDGDTFWLSAIDGTDRTLPVRTTDGPTWQRLAP